MKAHYRPTPRLTLEFEGDIPEIVAAVAQAQEVFEADTTCGCCGQPNLRWRVRTVDENRFTELFCLDCRAVLAFGQTKRGQLFAKRKEGDRWLENRGWKVWQPGAGSRQPAGDPAPAAAAKW